MWLSFHKSYLKRYQEIIRLLVRYGRTDLVQMSRLEEILDPSELDSISRSDVNQLAADLERLGPAYIKVGQFLSSRSDLLPQAYTDALARLQDSVAPFPFEEVRQILQVEFDREVEELFDDFSETPLAAASLGQVHVALTKDGRRVAVKIQRPDIRKMIVDDLEAVTFIAEVLDRYTELGRRYEFSAILQALRESIFAELDYEREAQNLAQLGSQMKGFDRIVVPAPLKELTTPRVLTMEYIPSHPITSQALQSFGDKERHVLADQIFRSYLKQIVEEGFFHADPHTGNVYLTEDRRIALFDLGMIGRIGPLLQEQLLQLILSISEGRGNDAAMIAMRMGQMKSDFDRQHFTRHLGNLVTHYYKSSMGDLKIGKIVMQINRIAAESNFRLPSEYTMAAKAMLQLDKLVSELDPAFRPVDCISENAALMVRRRLAKSINVSHFLRTVLETKEFIVQLPPRINHLLDALARNNFTVRVETENAGMIMEGFQKIANRITTGLVLSALIIGAALLCRVPSSLTLFGYPMVAIVFFVLAGVGALILIYRALFNDHHSHRAR
jgi:predicted unusual protein kinase regulating ubiquinone biosynthesis (AarF/ABC1/UbiB family)